MDAQAFKYIAIGVMAAAFVGAAIAVASIFVAALNGIARNPSSEPQITKYVFVGAGLAEAMGLFALVVVLLLIFG